MSQFYDLASLVVIPSGYKASTIYAQKPLTTDGQLSFSRASTATRVNASGLIEAVASNVPRLDYLGSSCPRLLLEPQRTNLVTYSEQFNNAAWTKEQVTITANATTSPDGTINADKIIANATAGDKYVVQIFTVAIGNAFTTSAYFKSSEYTYAFIRFGGLVSNPYVIYNLATQSVVTTSGLTSSSITSVGNGWYRITATVTSTTITLAPVLMVIPSTGYTLGADNIPEFTGDGTSGGFIWGAQIEAGAYATSYIPTLAASVTRVADAASITGLTGKNIIPSSTSFTAYFELILLGNEGPSDRIRLTDSDFLPRAYLYHNSAGVTSWSGNELLPMNTKVKVAYTANSATSISIYEDGSLAETITDTGANPLTFERLLLDGANGAFVIEQILLFPTALTAAQLAELTAL
jgi:hypothetical protein